MLQKVDFEDDFQPLQEDRSHLLRPAFYWELFKRRWAYFVLPFVTILAVGVAAALLWPPTYLSEGQDPRSVAADPVRTGAPHSYQRGAGTHSGHSAADDDAGQSDRDRRQI